jgi:hypothetical protein
MSYRNSRRFGHFCSERKRNELHRKALRKRQEAWEKRVRKMLSLPKEFWDLPQIES